MHHNVRLAILALALSVLCASTALAQTVQGVPEWPGVTLPTFVLPASAVNGGGVISTTCLTWPLGTTLCEDAAQRLTQRNTTTAERLDVANTWASTSSHEVFSADWQSQANVLLLGTRTAATGTTRPMMVGTQISSGADVYAGLRTSLTGAPYMRLGLFNAAGTAGSLGTISGNVITLGEGTSTLTSGSFVSVAVTPTYNQSASTAANTDLLINRTETAVGSGAQNFIDAQRGGTSQFRVTAGRTAIGTQISAAQQTAPTCSSNCGTSPSVTGSDSSMLVTMGSSGVPASGWVVTFNGTWALRPACIVQMAKAGMVVGKMPLTVVTTTTTITVVTNGTAPSTTDEYQIICMGRQ